MDLPTGRPFLPPPAGPPPFGQVDAVVSGPALGARALSAAVVGQQQAAHPVLQVVQDAAGGSISQVCRQLWIVFLDKGGKKEEGGREKKTERKTFTRPRRPMVSGFGCEWIIPRWAVAASQGLLETGAGGHGKCGGWESCHRWRLSGGCGCGGQSDAFGTAVPRLGTGGGACACVSG